MAQAARSRSRQRPEQNGNRSAVGATGRLHIGQGMGSPAAGIPGLCHGPGPGKGSGAVSTDPCPRQPSPKVYTPAWPGVSLTSTRIRRTLTTPNRSRMVANSSRPTQAARFSADVLLIGRTITSSVGAR